MTIRTCVPADPQSKGGSEATVRIAKADLVPTEVEPAERVPHVRAAGDRLPGVLRAGQRPPAPGDPPPPGRGAGRGTRSGCIRCRAQPFTVAFGTTRRVNWDATVSVEGVRYSVPHQLVDTRVWVRFHGDDLVVTAVGERRAGPRSPATPRSTPGTPVDPRRALPAAHAAAERRRTHPAGHAAPRRPRSSRSGPGAASWLVEAAAAGRARGPPQDGRGGRAGQAAPAPARSTARWAPPRSPAGSPRTTCCASWPTRPAATAPSPPPGRVRPTACSRAPRAWSGFGITPPPMPLPTADRPTRSTGEDLTRMTITRRATGRRPQPATRWPRRSSSPAGSSCPTSAAPARSGPDRARRSAGTPPKSSGSCSPRKPPAATRANLRTRRKRAGFPAGKTFARLGRDRLLHPPPHPGRAHAAWNGSAAGRTCASAARRAPASRHFCEALGQAAVEAGMTVAWFTIEDLGALVRRHRADDSITRALARLIRTDLIIVDDIGLLPVSPDAAEGFYRLVDAAYERRSLAVARQPAPLRLRRDHAQDPGHRHGRPAPAPRPRRRHPR